MRLVAVFVLGCAPAIARAQELPVRAWGVRDGLIQSRVNDVFRDSNGYVWFATWEGVSRFDGRRFVNYGTREGLPNPLVWCVAEDTDGVIWLGTHGRGLASIDPRAPASASAVTPCAASPAKRVFEIAFDRDARMWISSEAGLAVGERAPSAAWRFEHVDAFGDTGFGRAFKDERGDLWFIGERALVRCRGRELERFELDQPSDLGELRAVEPRQRGGCWVAYVRSLCELELPHRPGDVARSRRVEFGLDANTSLYAVREDSRGRVWVGGSHGLARIDGNDVRWFGFEQGLPDDWVLSLRRDDRGGLWIGTHHGGAAFLPDRGSEHFTPRSGLGGGNALELLPLDGERWLVSTEVDGLFELDSGRVRRVPLTERPPFDRIQSNLVADARGDWWIGTAEGVYRVGGPELDLARAQPLGDANGLPSGQAGFVLGLDEHGEAVIAIDTGRVFVHLPERDAFREVPFVRPHERARGFAFDRTGSLWLFDVYALWRLRAGAVEEVTLPSEDASEPFQPRSLFVDSRGWLWVGSRFNGVAYTREPALAAPKFERLTTHSGLSSDTVFAITEDRDGALYFGTARGVDRFQPGDGVLEHFGPADGLAGEWVNDLRFDRHGALWVAASGGVTRIDREARTERPAPPRVRFTRCVVAGEELALPTAGAFEVPPIETSASDSHLAFEFVAVDPVDGERLRYQTRLEGLDDGWSEPSRELSARYGQLPPREYRFLVRSVDASGGATSEPSSLLIRVFPPLWQRAWFVALAALALVGASFAWHRARLARALALERLRTQIATDLHDDLGAGLAQIAILSEVAKRASSGEPREVMGEVAELARALRGSMSDLVWAVDPRRDTLAELASRMRQFAGDLLMSDGLVLEFHTPPENELARLELAPDLRRGLYFAFKEAVTNVARHAHASRVVIELALLGPRIRVSIRDDGRGFDPTQARDGNGLGNLHRRAQQLGGELALESAPDRGTSLRLECPLRPA